MSANIPQLDSKKKYNFVDDLDKIAKQCDETTKLLKESGERLGFKP